MFEFAKSVRAKCVIATPAPRDLERLDALAAECGVRLAVLGGTGPYATPLGLNDTLTGRTDRVACCDDTAEWTRAGVDPVAATRTTVPRVVDVRLQDVDADGKPVPLGTGTLDCVGPLAGLKQGGFKGIVTLGGADTPEAARLETLIASVNAFSDAITRVTADVKEGRPDRP